MFEFAFSVRSLEASHSHSDVEFFYVMEGIVNFTLEDRQFLLRKGDFLVVNVDRSHSYQAEGECLVAWLHLSFAALSRMMKKTMILFWCNTAVDNNEACGELRAIFQKILTEQYFHQGQNEIYLNGLYYEFLHVLTSDFQLNKDDRQFEEEAHKFDLRKHEIAEYIRLNFDKQISLEDLADKLFLSYAYLSKYIKRHFGMGFADYVNSVRLNFAVSQLLHSDQSVVRIALESGFASSAALNKAFKEKYGMTPTEYRRKWIRQEQRGQAEQDETATIRRQLERHFANQANDRRDGKKEPEELVTLTSLQRRVLKKSWNKLINMGTATDLLRSDMQKHVLHLKEELHFEYVRFWDLYAPEMLLDSSAGVDSFNFENLDRVLDFLTSNGLKPYIELRPKPKVLLEYRDKYRVRQDNGTFFDDPVQIERFMRRLIIHLLNRYHSDLVETWYFELWHAEPEEVWSEANRAEEIMSSGQYVEIFTAVARVLRDYLPTVQIGGGGFSLRYGEDLFRQLLQCWKEKGELPDFVSIYCYPYTPDSISSDRNQSKNPDFARDTLTRVREILEEVEFPARELHVSEWSFSVSNRNVLNDHCMKGAYLVRNMIDCAELTDMMGYWVGSDLYGVYYDTTTVVNGGGGLLSKDGIPKPAYYAFYFMNRLGKYLRKKGENYIITDNGAGNWRIVCHNLKTLNYQYGLYNENEVRLEEQNNLFIDLKKLRMRFDLPAKRNGKYLLRIYSVNQNHGSLQDEWRAMSQPEDLSRDDLKYLSRITTPRMVMLGCNAENGKMSFRLTLEPNEIVYVHATYEYT